MDPDRLTLDVEAIEGVNLRRVEEDTVTLDEDLRRLRDVKPSRPRAHDPAPHGAKGATADQVTQLIVTAGPGMIAPIVTVVRSWMARSSARRVTVRLDGHELVLDRATEAQQEAAVQAWLARVDTDRKQRGESARR